MTAADSFEVFLSHVRARIDDARRAFAAEAAGVPGRHQRGDAVRSVCRREASSAPLTLAAADAVARSRHPHNETASAQAAEPDSRAAIDDALYLPRVRSS